ncbi:sulfurtransferase TusA family protein [Shouchella sp. JSM 1781072]|uniref:sulfurtransferase TusA family protein n=1 Tax=Bacillaceae TaxID=186817 RepID=UPI00159B98E9|nr:MULTISPECIES: sulfurtransferase TusA family protein [Bacillaceae]UTR06862.1 sulfurtransferase TusA family protein [Alkalihalobacillus sp. LMS6]
MEEMKYDLLVDAKGLACPMPIVRTKKAMKDIKPGSVVQIQATDKGSTADLKAWAQKAGHSYIGTVEDGDILKHYLRVAGDHEEEGLSFPHVVNNEGLQTAIQNNEPMTILDVREKNEYEEFHIPGAQSMPLGELEKRIQEVDKEKTIYVVCRTGNRSELAAHTLLKNGYKHVVNVIPGMSQWKTEGGN